MATTLHQEDEKAPDKRQGRLLLVMIGGDRKPGAPKCELPALLWTGWHAKVGTVVSAGGSGASPVVRVPHATLSTTSKQAWADLAALGAKEKAHGAIRIDQNAGTFLIDTPRTAGGFAESGAHDAGALRFALAATPATVWASSLDGQPLPESSRILVAHLTDVQNSGVRYRDLELRILEDWGGLPHLARNGAAEIALATADGDWRAWRLNTAGLRLGEIPVERDPATGRLVFTARTDYDPDAATLFYELEKH